MSLVSDCGLWFRPPKDITSGFIVAQKLLKNVNEISQNVEDISQKLIQNPPEHIKE